MGDGFLLVDKAGGWTSHDVVDEVRRRTGVRKVGHAGTLDPMATGLLVVGIGRATRLLRFVQDLPKTYLAGAVFGVATDTLDADGAVLERHPMPVSEAELRTVARRFVGRIPQVPPMVSAVRVGGRRLYELAREGKEVERQARMVEVHEVEVLEFSPCNYPEAMLRVVCGTGTYVRTLADDIAGALGGRAHLTSLRRLSIGSLGVDEAVSIAPPAEGSNERSADLSLLEPAEGLRDLPALWVGEEVGRAVGHGAAFPAAALGAEPAAAGPHRVLDHEGRLLAVYGVTDRTARPEVVLA